MSHEFIADVRAFNRFYTRLIGALDAGHVETPYSLTEARTIYEIGKRGPVSHGDLARALKLDPGYVTRLNARLTELGLISVTSSESDKRTSQLVLTREGDKAFRALNAATDTLVGSLIEPLTQEERAALTSAMRVIRDLLGDVPPAPKPPVILRPHRIGDLGWMIHRQGLIYNQQFGWNIEFEALISRIYSEYESAPASPPRNLWVAEQGGAIVGSIFVMPSEGIEGSAQLRMLYVEPNARGQGVGTALVAQAVGFARGHGYARMRLWTHTVQEAARRVYAAAGFTIVETMEEDNFGKTMIGEIWELRF